MRTFPDLCGMPILLMPPAIGKLLVQRDPGAGPDGPRGGRTRPAIIRSRLVTYREQLNHRGSTEGVDILIERRYGALAHPPPGVFQVGGDPR
jgi:hypothetical protein